MAINIPTGTTQYDIEDEGKTYILKANATLDVTGTDSAIFGASGIDDDKIIVKGDITQTGDGFAAVVLSGTGMALQVSKTGSILGESGVEFIGATSSLVNDGLVKSVDPFGYGVYFEGLNTAITNTGKIIATGADSSGIGAFGINSVITNSGTIQGGYGINMTDGNMTIKLGDGSVVQGTNAAIFSENTEPSDKINITNNGDIIGVGTGYAIETQDARETVVNHGDIQGRIYLGSGEDVFDNRGGKVDHAIEGGAGDDTLITDKAGVKLKENGGSEGFDTVKSTVSYTLSENVERLILMGNKNINGKGTEDGDVLQGNAGNNKLSGIDGSGSDTFIFKTGGGHDTITDFDAGTDKIDLVKWEGIDNFNDVKSHLTSAHGDLFITVGDDQLIINDTAKSELQASDFFFHM